MMRALLSFAFLFSASTVKVHADDDFPQQIHIAAGSRTSFRVSWKTTDVTASTCLFGPTSDNLNRSVFGPPGYQYLKDHGFHHTVLLDELPMGSRYFYSCGDGDALMSPVIGFNTAPSPSDEVSMAIFGDWGYLDSEARPMEPVIGNLGGLHANWTATLTRELLETLKENAQISMLWVTGDIGYADDSFGHQGAVITFGYEPCFDGFMQWNENISKIMPFMVSVGNHESECHDPYCLLHVESTGVPLSNFSAYNARFKMPSPESGGALSMWASWEWGPVHITSLNTETDFEGAGEEFTGDGHFSFLPAGGFGLYEGEYLAWLEADLAKAAANPDVSWLVAGGHRPFEDLPAAMQSHLQALFLKHGVAMYFAGHGHTYTRFDSGAWGDGAVHVMAGGAGNEETLFPADQFDDVSPLTTTTAAAAAATTATTATAAATAAAKQSCESWCVRQKKAMAELAAATAVTLKIETAVGGNNTAALHASNADGPVGLVLSIPSEGSDTGSAEGPRDPCVHCRAPPGTADGPVFATDKMSAGVLRATTSTLVWSLLRAPDGAVLDTVTLVK